MFGRIWIFLLIGALSISPAVHAESCWQKMWKFLQKERVSPLRVITDTPQEYINHYPEDTEGLEKYILLFDSYSGYRIRFRNFARRATREPLRFNVLYVKKQNCKLELSMDEGILKITDAQENYDEQLASMAKYYMGLYCIDTKVMAEGSSGRRHPTLIRGPAPELLFLSEQILNWETAGRNW